MTGPGSVHMEDAEDVIEILSSEGADEDHDGSSEEAMSDDGSDGYGYDSSEDGSDMGLGDDPRPASTTEKKAPYRIIDGEVLKQVQVRPTPNSRGAVLTPLTLSQIGPASWQCHCRHLPCQRAAGGQ